MDIKTQIEQIISIRKEKAQKLRDRQKEVVDLKNQLLQMRSELASNAAKLDDEELKSQYSPIFSNINLTGVLKNMDQLSGQLGSAIKRFERDYISVATVGKERQGKSRFLQSVGDLDNSIIPAYDATSCTGATSVIWNKTDMEPGAVRAVINFRQPNELLDIVMSYINTIDSEFIGEEGLDFDSIGYIDMGLLYTRCEYGNANHTTAYEHLKAIVDHFPEIKELFGSSSVTLTNKEEIKKYVAQNNGKGIDDPDVEFYFKYLAVSRADIYCRFFSDTGKVRLVDTVGIGDTQFGIEDAMLNTVDKECDAAIVVTRPVSGVQEGDIQLYSSLRDKFIGRDTGKWLFYLVNHFEGQNDNTVEAFCRDVKNGKWSIADCKVINVSDQLSVRDDFVIPMLEKLLANMDEIDAAYMKVIDDNEDEVRRELQRFLGNLPDLQPINVNALMGIEAYQKGKRCFNRMSSELRNTVTEWAQERDKPNTGLWNAVNQILAGLDDIIPSPQTIDSIKEQNGWLNSGPLWELVLHYTRNQITDQFIEIDDILEKETREFKNSLVDTLYKELRQLSPGWSPESEESEDKVKWLKTMMDGVLHGKEEYVQIVKAFDFLYKFEFNTRAQIIQEVRRQLYIINPICAEYAKPTIDFQHNGLGRQVHFFLTSRMSVIEDELRFHLSKLYRTPNLAFYAAAEEFFDRLIFASDISGGEIVDMSDVWGQFFLEFASSLWEDTGRYEVLNSLIGRYNEMKRMLTDFLAPKAAA